MDLFSARELVNAASSNVRTGAEPTKYNTGQASTKTPTPDNTIRSLVITYLWYLALLV